uniref:Uncharacterized protein n=1 Tax=Anopheles culicifacies TaxID=139723 RepID=A0A182M292_9DIPT
MALEETQNNGSAVAVAPKENAPPPLKQQPPQGQAQVQPSTSNEKLNNLVNGGGATMEKSRSNNKQSFPKKALVDVGNRFRTTVPRTPEMMLFLSFSYRKSDSG